MSSVISNFEYDIFISYRQNDNRSGWVTEFVKHLNEELAATIKEPLSIYFDKNPHDGLLETHDVDKSLEGKLKCLIFIPIISQTYCDPKSFAWQSEFCFFNKFAKEDPFSRDLKLTNGNVASRILPVQIHEVDEKDKAIFENEMGGTLRAIEFIYKEPGVNRPLKLSDSRSVNQNRTDYANQINKVANAVKELIRAMQNPSTATDEIVQTQNANNTSHRKPILKVAAIFVLIAVGYFVYQKVIASKKSMAPDKSIAVLPFIDMSPSKDQEFLGDGIADDIINALSKIKGLKVIGRTSSFQFKGEKVDLRELGNKLNVSTVLEGSLIKSGDKLRITAQLINVGDNSQIWSEQYNKEMKDIFLIQDEISRLISQKINVTVNQTSLVSIQTTSLEAYENCLLGRRWLEEGVRHAQEAIPFFKRAIQLDSTYADAYHGLGIAHFFKSVFRFVPAENDTAIMMAKKVLSLTHDYRGHMLLFVTYGLNNWQWSKAEAEYRKALESTDVDIPYVGHALYLESAYDDRVGAINEMKRFLAINPLHKDALRILAGMYITNRELMQGRATLEKLLQIDPYHWPAYILFGELNTMERKFNEALNDFKKVEVSSEIPADITFAKIGQVRVLAASGDTLSARKMFESIVKSEAAQCDLAAGYFALGDHDKGFECLNKAYERHDPPLIYLRVKLGFDPARKDPRYFALVKKMNFPE